MEPRLQLHGSKHFACTDPPPDPAKIQLFLNIVMLHIKLKGMMHAATW